MIRKRKHLNSRKTEKEVPEDAEKEVNPMEMDEGTKQSNPVRDIQVCKQRSQKRNH